MNDPIYLWVLQNQIAFKSSTSVWWTSTNGIPVAISNVIVGSLGDYQAMENVVDIGPVIPSNSPGYSEAKEYQVDISNVYYELSIPDIWITPRDAVAGVGGSNVQFTVTGTNIPGGVTWTITPSGVGATIQSSGAVTPGNVATNYKIRATSVDNTNFYDEVPLVVLKVESIQPDSMTHLQEIDDGDENPNTRVFIVPIADALEFPVVPATVRATLSPNLSESQVPSGMTLAGGIGSEKLNRTVNRSVAAGPSKTEFTFNCNGSDSVALKRPSMSSRRILEAKVGIDE